MRAMIMTIVLALWGFALPAQTLPAQTLPDAVAKQIKANPARFTEDAAVLIHGYGTNGAIDAQTIDRVIALERAGARASAIRRVMAADLDADGAVTGAELAFTASVASARQRGRLLAMLAKVDGDSDGTASAVEIATYAAAEGLRALSAGQVRQMQGMMSMDADSDGNLTLPEVQRAVDRLSGAT